MSEPPAAASRTDAGGKPWGFWPTIGFGVLIFAVWSAIQVIASLMLLGRGAKASDAFAQGWVTAWAAIISAPMFLALMLASDLLTLALGRPVVPEPMIPVYQTAGSLPIFLIGLVVAVPLAEEFLFRGFLFAGFVESRLGPVGAIALTALTWASLHIQYDFYGVATVAVGGVLLGLIRWRTGSLWLCALLHGLMNAVASVEAAFVLSGR